jgi:hypothetical protein
MRLKFEGVLFPKKYDINILYNVGGFRSVLNPNCTRYSTEDAVRIDNSFIKIPITRHYNHSQLSITLLRVYTIIILTR